VSSLALSSELRPECKLQIVNAKPKPNNYRSSAECRSVAEPNQAEAFGRTVVRCLALTELRCTSIIGLVSNECSQSSTRPILSEVKLWSPVICDYNTAITNKIKMLHGHSAITRGLQIYFFFNIQFWYLRCCGCP